MYDFERCIGVELLENLHKKSVEMKEVYEGYCQKNRPGQTVPKFEVFQGDILEFDWWTTSDLVLANSTCFDLSLMLKIAEKASLMKKGSWMITLTKKLPTADPLYTRDPDFRDWECVLSIKMVMSWGYATVNVQRKIK